LSESVLSLLESGDDRPHYEQRNQNPTEPDGGNADTDPVSSPSRQSESGQRKRRPQEREQEQPPPIEGVVEEEELADKRKLKRKAQDAQRTADSLIRHPIYVGLRRSRHEPRHATRRRRMEDDASATPDAVRTDAGRLAAGQLVAVGIGSGLLGALTLAVPIVLWDWSRDGHHAFEYAMAPDRVALRSPARSATRTTGWSLVLGLALLASGAISGVVFTALCRSPGTARRSASFPPPRR
jgi:hypothetical protein